MSGQICFAVTPRDVPPVKAARRLHLTRHAFDLVLPDLLARGFPPPDATTGNFDLRAIDAWMDTRSGALLTNHTLARNAAEEFGERLDRLRDGQ